MITEELEWKLLERISENIDETIFDIETSKAESLNDILEEELSYKLERFNNHFIPNLRLNNLLRLFELEYNNLYNLERKTLYIVGSSTKRESDRSYENNSFYKRIVQTVENKLMVVFEEVIKRFDCRIDFSNKLTISSGINDFHKFLTEGNYIPEFATNLEIDDEKEAVLLLEEKINESIYLSNYSKSFGYPISNQILAEERDLNMWIRTKLFPIISYDGLREFALKHSIDQKIYQGNVYIKSGEKVRDIFTLLAYELKEKATKITSSSFISSNSLNEFVEEYLFYTSDELKNNYEEMKKSIDDNKSSSISILINPYLQEEVDYQRKKYYEEQLRIFDEIINSNIEEKPKSLTWKYSTDDGKVFKTSLTTDKNGEVKKISHGVWDSNVKMLTKGR